MVPKASTYISLHQRSFLFVVDGDKQSQNEDNKTVWNIQPQIDYQYHTLSYKGSGIT